MCYEHSIDYAGEYWQSSRIHRAACLARALETCHGVTRIAFCAADVFRCSSQDELDVSFWFTGRSQKLRYRQGRAYRNDIAAGRLKSPPAGGGRLLRRAPTDESERVAVWSSTNQTAAAGDHMGNEK